MLGIYRNEFMTTDLKKISKKSFSLIQYNKKYFLFSFFFRIFMIQTFSQNKC